MGTAYTPGLMVSGDIVVRKERRLPLAGEILVSKGDPVEAGTAVARALLPGDLVTVRAADELGSRTLSASPRAGRWRPATSSPR